MIRFVVGPDGGVVPDVDERLPGRGLWLSASRNMVNTAARKGLFAKAARRRVAVADDLAERIEALLARRASESLGLARRAGDAVAGFEKVRARLKEGRAGLLLQALDGAADGRRRTAALAGDRIPVIPALTAAELGGAMGRDHAVHVAVAPGRLAERLERDARRLAGFREAPQGPPRGPESGAGSQGRPTETNEG